MYVKIPRIDQLLVNVSGAELEVLHRILGKAQVLNLQVMDGKQYNVIDPAYKQNVTIEVLPGAIDEISAQEYEDYLQRKALVERAEAARFIIDSYEADPTAARARAKSLRSELYYRDSVIKYNDRESYYWEEQSLEHDCVDFMLAGAPTIRVNRNGTIETFPV